MSILFAARTLVADANQLFEELCDFLRVGDDNLARSFYGKLESFCQLQMQRTKI